ncbi:M14 family zinc carboxypeptidase [Solibacillus sp. FSL W7-1464]|uniref:M14 family zinc carboxypeptidase n=1 Tax=Solibacillus sp. FSL W7-1464 TaxID=2921706 RepID=UPI0030F8AEF5
MRKLLLFGLLFTAIFNFSAHSAIAETATIEFGKYPVQVIANKHAELKDEQGKVIKTVAKGDKLLLQALKGDSGVIKYASKSAFIPITDIYYVQLVDGAKVISYDEVAAKLKLVSTMYPTLTKLQEIGNSVEGRPLYSLKIGTGKKEVLMDASFHGREHMTTNVLMEMIDTYINAYVNGTKIEKYDVKKILSEVSLVFVPMVNPDGVTLAQGGKVNTSLTKLKAMNNNSTNFNRWKANMNGVDLNRQFNVNWHLIKTTKPSFKEYKGKAPNTEPEALAIKQLIDRGNHLAYVSYHSSGQIIYWSQTKTNFSRTKKLVKGVSSITGYKLMPVTKKSEPIAASEDYFTKVKDRPAMTVEIAPYAGEASVPLKRWNNVWKQNKTVGLYVANEARNW